MVGAVLPQADGQRTGWSDQAVLTTAKTLFVCLSFVLSIPSSSSRPLCVRRMNGWLSLSVSGHTTLSSSVSLLELSFLCKNVRLVYHSLHPSLHLSDGYPSLLTFFPRQPIPLSPRPPPVDQCVLCVYLKCECACTVVCVCLLICFSMCFWLRLCVCICVCQIVIYPPIPPSSPSPLSVCVCVWSESRSVGICQQTPPSTSLQPTHPPTGFVCIVPIQPSRCPHYACLSSV